MENPIEILKSITTLESNETYTTELALEYFKTINFILHTIGNHLIEATTGDDAMTPENMRFSFQLSKNIDDIENFLEMTNKNDRNSVKNVLGIKNILIRFDTIKQMMLGTDKKLRADGYQLFLRTANLYSDEEVQQFVSLLNDNEVNNIVGILNAERYLIEKELTNTPMQYYIIQRTKLLQERKISSAKYTNNDEEQR